MFFIDNFIKAINEFGKLIAQLAMRFTWKDILDIAIVALLIYGVIKLIKESRAGQLVKGLVFFFLMFAVSNIFDLGMLNKILWYFFQSAFIAILIVFQPEIRKALEQMGRSNVGKSIANVVSTKDKDASNILLRKSINSVVDAMVILQRLKMGAIVVFEKETKLGEILETGTLIDAMPSSKILANIFYNKSPLHDGAVIIRKGRVLSAGCILPLTRNDALSSSIGTRHRAALGMSEDSDSVVIVLSEETGQISIAVNGSLTRDYSKDTLREALNELLFDKNETKKVDWIKRSIFQRKKGV